MSFDVKKALMVPYNDEKLAIKLGIALVFYIPMLIVSLNTDEKSLIGLMAVLATCLITGYAYIGGKNELNNEYPILPDWNLKECFVVFIKTWLISMGWAVTIIPIALIVFVFSLFNPLLFTIAILLAIPCVIAYITIVNVALSMFLKELKLADAFDFSEVFRVFKENYGKYLKYFLWMVLISVGYSIIGAILSGILSSFVGKATGHFAETLLNIPLLITNVNLLAQAYKQVNDEPQVIEI